MLRHKGTNYNANAKRLLPIPIIICPNTCLNVLPQALFVKPRLGPMIIAYVQKSTDGRIPRSAESFHHQHVMLRRNAHSYRILQRCRRRIRPPVHGIDAHRAGDTDNRLDILHVGHRVIANRNPKVRRVLRRLDIRGRCHILRRYPIAHDVRRHQIAMQLFGHDFQQFHHRLRPLAEARQDKRPLRFALFQECLKGRAHILESQLVAATYRILILRFPSLDGCMPVVRRIKIVAQTHVSGYPTDFFVHICPVLGVVQKLPGNVDFISSSFFLEQDFNDYSNPFYMTNPEYASSLHYYVPESIDLDSFENAVLNTAELAGIRLQPDRMSFYVPQIVPFKAGTFISFFPSDSIDCPALQQVGRDVLAEYSGSDLTQVFDFSFSDSYISQISFISIHFKDLEMIKEFEGFVKEQFYIQIEMSQINAKENFNSVSVMANILSWAIVVFSILCIILFIVNLLQSYFQKVKRNLGTFKAFGISNSELIRIYVLIMAATIIAAVLIAFASVYVVQLILPLFGVLKDGTFNYLSVWSMKTLYAVVIIMICSVSTVYLLMSKLLSATPGDLIYDRQ